MRIGVCVKIVADTESKISLNLDNRAVNKDSAELVINPYDEYALEEALKYKDKCSENEIVIFSVGEEKNIELLRIALSMGADRACYVVVDKQTYLDGLSISNIIKRLAEVEKIDVLFMGKQSVDDGNNQVVPMVGVLLDWAYATNVIKLQIEETHALATRQAESGIREVLELKKPFVISVTKGINEPRYPSLKGIMSAKKKEIKKVDVKDLGINIEELCSLEVEGYYTPKENLQCKIIEGEPCEVSKELISLLRYEAKVL